MHLFVCYLNNLSRCFRETCCFKIYFNNFKWEKSKFLIVIYKYHNMRRYIKQKSLTSRILMGADKSLARPGRKQAAPVKIVMARGMDRFG